LKAIEGAKIVIETARKFIKINIEYRRRIT
jgi:hypothetical protein